MAKLVAAKKPPADPADVKAARQTALKLLARRDFSSGELQQRLTERGFNSATVAQVIAALKQERMLNDERYIEHFIAYHAGRGQGPIRIRQAMQRQGLAADALDAALAAASGEAIDWLTRAQELRRKKFGAKLPETYAEKAKQARFLQYRGFTGAQIRAALETDLDMDDLDTTVPEATTPIDTETHTDNDHDDT